MTWRKGDPSNLDVWDWPNLVATLVKQTIEDPLHLHSNYHSIIYVLVQSL